ncbi:MAG: hypothetical protein DI569_16610 [Sphingopyxis macrogoltabida]|uniref:Flagellar hook-length control protein-like C-terminal domain-containing protein n=1 Tax=Sphingopyxis macrogoltabida TaxID=33050 RepID=A0A2W5KVM8_SPHMC|nr:MAG: hypothetical protein DI569_16610 [Sphingopyxis macrogoltabida]
MTAAAAPKAPTTTSAPAGTKAPPEQTPVTAPPGKTRQKTPGQPQLVPALPRPIINTPPARQPKSGEPTQPQALITVPGLTVPGPTPPTDTPSNPVGAPIAQGTPKQPAPVDTGGPLLVSVPTPLPGADADAPPVPASAPSNTPAPAVSPLPFIVENLPAPIAPEGETAAPVAVSITASAKPAVPTATVVQQPAPAAPIATDVEAVTVLTAKTDAAPAAQPTPVSSPQVSTVSPATPQPVVAAASAPTETASTGSDATDSATAAPAQPAAPVMTAAVATPAPVAVEAAPFAESLAPALSEALAEKQLDLAAGDAWLDDLARDIVRTAGNEGPLRFRLNPETLGSLAIHVERRDDGAAIRIEADTEAAARVLSEAQPRLFAEARAQGLRIAESTVDHTHQQNASSQGQPQQQNGQTQQNAQNPQAQLASGNHPAPQNFGGQSGNHQRSSEDQKPFLVRDQVNAQTVSESEGPQAERYA